jgi:molecular chaperone GrpE
MSQNEKKTDQNKAASGVDKWKKIAEETEEPESSPQEETANVAGDLELTSRAQLENQLNALEMQVSELKEKLARSLAESDNIRRRTEKDIANAHKYGIEKIIKELLPVVDSLNRALEGIDFNDPKLNSIHNGIDLTLSLLNKALEKSGAKVIDPQIGDRFDPTVHEAMSIQESPNAEPNTILQVLQKGYQLHDRVLRAAMVVVAKE